jgi:glucose/arabinose dehydrogenase
MSRLHVLLVLLAVSLVGLTATLPSLKRAAVIVFSEDYTATPGEPLAGRFDGADADRARAAITLLPRFEGFEQPVELAFVPGQPQRAIVLEKTGTARWLRLDGSGQGAWLTVEVNTHSEMGLLGIAFHPEFPENGRFFIHYNQGSGASARSTIQEWRVPAGKDVAETRPSPHHVLLEVPQPYPNHDGGQLLFGADGMLYVPLGDGGFRDDPHGNGQDLSTLLGSILRLDVEQEPYGVPADNPHLGREGARPEIWAHGVRNPWRTAWAPDGRLIVADVGQNAWEEVGYASAGSNLGWAGAEGFACFPPKKQPCDAPGEPPFWAYGRDEGSSVTGGQVAQRGPLAGKYVFGDFAAGRLWALELPREGRAAPPLALGRWPIRPTSFALAPDGGLWVVDFGGGRLMEILARPS